jgi:rhodanese-related sulfurtransferase
MLHVSCLRPIKGKSKGRIIVVKSATVTDLQAALVRGERVIDVREKHEYDRGHVPNALHIPMSIVPLRVQDIKGERNSDPVWIICESGARSWQVSEYLTRQGVSVINVDGGTSAWKASGLPVHGA